MVNQGMFSGVEVCDQCGGIIESKYLHDGLCRTCYKMNGGFEAFPRRGEWDG
jgi:NMD protein affecting ribosome stability and mRNA decay